MTYKNNTISCERLTGVGQCYCLSEDLKADNLTAAQVSKETLDFCSSVRVPLIHDKISEGTFFYQDPLLASNPRKNRILTTTDLSFFNSTNIRIEPSVEGCSLVVDEKSEGEHFVWNKKIFDPGYYNLILTSKKNQYPAFLYLIENEAYLIPWIMNYDPWRKTNNNVSESDTLTLISRETKNLGEQTSLIITINVHKKAEIEIRWQHADKNGSTIYKSKGTKSTLCNVKIDMLDPTK